MHSKDSDGFSAQFCLKHAFYGNIDFTLLQDLLSEPVRLVCAKSVPALFLLLFLKGIMIRLDSMRGTRILCKYPFKLVFYLETREILGHIIIGPADFPLLFFICVYP